MNVGNIVAKIKVHIFEGLERLRDLVPTLDIRFRYAVEVRHSSGFQDLAYNFFSNNDICLAWSHLAELQTPPILTTDFLYLRLIGDRSIHEKDFGRIQIDRVLEMQKWADNIKAIQDERIRLAIVTANNHYAVLGPGLRMYLEICWACQKPSGRIEKKKKNKRL